jgi:cobalt-zinc-cadmium efflux system outer membrane protein
VTIAESDQREAEEAVVKLRGDVEIAGHRLAKLLGLGLAEVAISASGLSPEVSVPADVPALIGDAFAARPDLRAAEIAIEAAVERAGLARSEAYKLTAVYDTNGSGSDFEQGPGMDLPVPFFDRNQAGRKRAEANIYKASKHYLVVRDQIVLEVREAHTRALQAQRSAQAWNRDIIPPLEGATFQAEKAYRGGAAPFLEVVLTTRTLTAARLRSSAALADLHRAAIDLDRAVGHPMKP